MLLEEKYKGYLIFTYDKFYIEHIKNCRIQDGV